MGIYLHILAWSFFFGMSSAGTVNWTPMIDDDDDQRLIELRLRALAEDTTGIPGELNPIDRPTISLEELDAMQSFPGNLGPLPQPEYPANNRESAERIELGKKLFFDRRLSRDRSMSCATCHDPNKGWSDNLALARGFDKLTLGRNTPTIINACYNSSQFWDGRAATLEDQATGPILAAGEMNMPNADAVVAVLENDSAYVTDFIAAYGELPNMNLVGRAIASFERTIVSGTSRFDQYATGNKDALNEAEKNGLILFMTKASCSACHKGPQFSDDRFHSLGVRQLESNQNDLGRYAVTKDLKDMYCFKTSGLRNVEQTAPYMHDGSLGTLEEVVEFYNKGGDAIEPRSNLIKPLNLTASEKSDLVQFLRCLTGELPSVPIPIGEHFGM